MSEGLNILINNPKTKETYRRGILLGRGGFAKCYEFENTISGERFAGKVVPKNILFRLLCKLKKYQEIEIHSSLSHKHIVSLHSYFEDESNIYIVLELCHNHSLTNMLKRRKKLTLQEVRYFMHQIVLACKYMHDNKVIHRDLKLDNIFLNGEMEIKVGDFGLAIRVDHEGQKVNTVCGTPNFMAPEIIREEGYSYEVDIWSLGCIMYSLLVGSPPFEASTPKSTYKNIEKCKYILPEWLDCTARQLIKKLLHPDAAMRPNANTIFMDDFLISGFIPSRLPTSYIHMQPIFFSVYNRAFMKAGTETKVSKIDGFSEYQINISNYYYFGDLFRMLESVMQCHPETLYTGQPEDAQDLNAMPSIWINKWLDHTNKHGMGYELCNNNIGVFFNDFTHLILLHDKYLYIEKNERKYFSTKTRPIKMNKKITLLKYFNEYMTDNLEKALEFARPEKMITMLHVPHLRAWIRTRSAMIFYLSNDNFQVNFFENKSKIILCPKKGAVLFINEYGNYEVYTIQLIKQFGCSQLLATQLRFVKDIVKELCKNCLCYDEFTNVTTDIYTIVESYKDCPPYEKNYNVDSATVLYQDYLSSKRKFSRDSTTELYATSELYNNSSSSKRKCKSDSATELYAISDIYKNCMSSEKKCNSNSITELYAISELYNDCISF